MSTSDKADNPEITNTWFTYNEKNYNESNLGNSNPSTERNISGVINSYFNNSFEKIHKVELKPKSCPT